MPQIDYENIYKRALSRIHDLDLANLPKEDFYDYMKEWLTSAFANPRLRKCFSSFVIYNDLNILEFELNYSVDEIYDINFVTNILAEGLIINYFPSKIEDSVHLAVMVGSEKEKKLIDNYAKKLERLKTLKTELNRELAQHGYYFKSYGDGT